MRARTGLRFFLAAVLIPVLALPAYNLREDGARTYAQRLVSEGRTDKLQQLAYNVDFLVAAWSALTWRTGLSTDPLKAIVGRDGWLFMGDRYSDNLSTQRTGITNDNKRLAGDIGNNLLAWEGWLRQQGVQAFVMQIGPDKHRVHARHLPDWAKPALPPRMQLLTQGPAGRLISDPTPALQRAISDGLPAPYYKTDSHWNLWGAAIAMAELRRTLQANGVALLTPLPDPPQIHQVKTRSGGDLSAFLRIKQTLRDEEPLPVGLDMPEHRSDIHNLTNQMVVTPAAHGQLQFPGLTLRVVTPGAANPLKVLWLRDSFGSALSPFFAAHFQETVQMHWTHALKDSAGPLVKLVETHKPDLVVLTLVERVALAELLLTPPPGR